MTGTISDPEVQRLAQIAEDLEGDFPLPADDPWQGSPFSWIKSRAPSTKGAIAEMLVERFCQENGLRADPRPDSDVDRLIEGRRVEIKSSYLWAAGIYKFQQFRDQDYDYGVCLGISPFAVHCWVIPKDIIMEKHAGQHGGKAAKDTKEFNFPANDPPDWLAPYGGSLSAALVLLRQLRS